MIPYLFMIFLFMILIEYKCDGPHKNLSYEILKFDNIVGENIVELARDYYGIYLFDNRMSATETTVC